MKTPIIRKPKFMRNDEGMKAYIKVADSISDCMYQYDVTSDEFYRLAKKALRMFK